VNRHWRDTLRGSLTLWQSTALDFGDADEERAGQLIAYVASRAQVGALLKYIGATCLAL
jgi:hypothetical protein